ncbi:MAG: DMT family transporter [Anaerolineae bacterium]|nr:DMT family transporter [Anaerolineae bacterium]
MAVGKGELTEQASAVSAASTLRKGALISTLSAACYAGAVVFIRNAYRAGLTPGTAVFLRFALASLVLTGVLSLSHQWSPLPRRHVRALFLLGFLAYTLLGITWFVALSVTPAWLVSLFVALYPLSINLGSWIFLRERIRRQQLMALAAVLAGGIILFARPSLEGVAWLGILLMFVNMIIQTAYVLVGQRWTRGVRPVISATWQIFGAAVGTFLYAILSGQLSFSFAPVGWLWAAMFAIVSTALAIMLLWWGIGLLGPARAAIFGAIEPFLAVLLSVLFLGERMSFLQAIGGALILVGMLLAQWQPELHRARPIGRE